MSARDVIATALFDWAGSGQGVDDMLAEIAQAQSDAILSALTAAGFRIVPPGGLDAASVERCAQAVEAAPNFYSDTYSGQIVELTKTGIASEVRALRSLIEEPTNDAR